MLTRSKKKRLKAAAPVQEVAQPAQVATRPEQEATRPEQEVTQSEKTRRSSPNRQTSGNDEQHLKSKLEELYTNIKSTPNYSAKINQFLRQYDLHSRHRRITKKIFPRRKVIARFKNDLWQADLIEYPNLRFYNKGYKYILLVIDVFSKVIYVEPLKRKTGDLTADAMDKILQRCDTPPVMLVTDGGKEFFNSHFRKVAYSYNINHFRTPTKTKWKASVAERANRTIKTRIQRWMTHTRKKSWISVYRQIVENYNKTPHSSHKLAPLDVSSENRRIVYQRLYPNSLITVECRLKKGDKVRKLREKEEYEKGYTPNWSEEIYEITRVFQRHTVCWYKLQDLAGNILNGIWYYNQLNLVARNEDQSASR